jgi:hypothetical protein
MTTAISRHDRFPWAWVVAVTVWTLLIAAGFGALLRYDFRTGEKARPDAGAAAVLAPWLIDRPFHLAIGLHPKCPCSRATVAELERLATSCDNEFDCIVLATTPAHAGDDWLDTPLLRAVRERLGATVVHDVNGVLAAELGMKTSGAIVLFDRTGEVRFSGGVTGSRGHEGDNDGEAAVRHIVHGQLHGGAVCSPVFGCPLVH